MPGGRIVATEELFERDPLPRPYVLKPVNEGSSVGVAIVTDPADYALVAARVANGEGFSLEERRWLAGRRKSTMPIVPTC